MSKFRFRNLKLINYSFTTVAGRKASQNAQCIKGFMVQSSEMLFCYQLIGQY